MRFALLLLLPLLAACGFEPLYGQPTATGQRVEQQLADVAIDNLPDRRGQQLRLLLSDRFYGTTAPAPTARYRLAVTYTASKQDLGIARDDSATRSRLNLTASYKLIDATSKEPLLEGKERAFVSYNILTGPYATLAAEENAYDRGLVQLADLLTNRVALYLAGKSAALPATTSSK